MSESDVAELVRRAAAGDRQPWRELVERYSAMMWAVARSHRLGEHVAADVVQASWLRLLEHIGDIREPAHLGGWLATTTRREALRVIAARRREEAIDIGLENRADPAADGPDDLALRADEHERVRYALGNLPPHQQRLLRLLSVEPRLSYAEIAAALGIPIGSVGPTRARALARLHALLELDAVSEAEATPAVGIVGQRLPGGRRPRADRRSGVDRRSTGARRYQGDRRSGRDRRSGWDGQTKAVAT